MGAWIETSNLYATLIEFSSHPTRVRGLKLDAKRKPLKKHVAPHTGAWIETQILVVITFGIAVAPHTGAWIET